MKELIYNGDKVRIKILKDEPWWVAKDVCSLLGVDGSNTKDSVKGLDDDEKIQMSNPSKGVSNLARPMWFVNESGLYALIFRSRKPEARAFRKWVTSEVLPAIRKTGEYKISKSLKEESTRARNSLTDHWKDCGVEKGYHYSNLTKEEYKALFGDRNKKKEFMTKREIEKLRAFEGLESFKLSGLTAQGYYGCKDSLKETISILADVEKRQIKGGLD